ncbi:MAG: glycosyltransferase family 4 protein [Thiohalophilus sp.]|uniref:glycosyltransferase family 4 protein n=1 Tax=Thiohalophilus sp. TaxID=3028392 RepID=UPI00286FC0EE|nr:glycosyltransferase family 4 protein [Thiohalophilus sp.]MDR9437532.1 glycosyltransferase family 4 protein [Thiohalophilus sp.]
MRILELCTSRGRGGLELYALKNIQHLKGPQHVVHAAVREGTYLDEAVQEEGIPCIRIDPRSTVLPYISARKLARYIDDHEIDLIHAHWQKDVMLAALAKRLSKRHCKLMFMRHIRLTRQKKDAYHRFIYHSIDKYIVITRVMYEEALKYLPMAPSQIELLYHGVEDASDLHADVDCGDFLAQHGIRDDQFRVLLPGRVEWYKAQHTLIDAVARLKEEGVDVQACIMGHVMFDSYLEKLKKQARDKGIGDQVKFIGFVDNSRAYYKCFDVVALTTYIETFGLVLVEAMLSGVPVIGTRAGGVPEIIEHDKTGLLFEAGNEVELARCIRQMVENPQQRDAMARAGQSYAREMFSNEVHYARLDEIIQELESEVAKG